MLLALSINNIESIQAYVFYILQYSISNLNAFIILVTIGYTLRFYINDGIDIESYMLDKKNSPIQLIHQIKGYFYINSFISISLAVTIFSFIGVPPLIGFFAKQMILSAALDEGYIFMALFAILTSVIGAGYYLNLIRYIFFYGSDHVPDYHINNTDTDCIVSNRVSGKKSYLSLERLTHKMVFINSSLSAIISILTLLLLLFMCIPGE